MKNTIWFASTLILAASLHLSHAADVTGSITLKGTPAPEKPIDQIKSDAFCSKLHTSVPKTRFFVVGADGKLADVVVSLKGDSLKGKSTGASASPLAVDQKGCEYIPYVAAAQTKQKIMVKNSDPMMHNVHPTPTAPGNKEANKAQMPKAADLEFAFDNPEAFLRFKCDVHPWMFSYISIFDHPYFAVTGTDGSFTIKNVPDGKYTLEASHRKAGTASKEIEVKGGNVTQDLTLELK